jgi:hypothetical protein
MVRLSLYQEDDYGGCIDLPNTCSIRTAVRSYVARGWIEVTGLTFVDGKVRMMNEYGTLCVIENVVELTRAESA